MPGPSLSGRGDRYRTILVNQMLLSAAALLATVASVLLGQVQDATLFIVGSTLVFAGAVAAILVPWQRFPHWVVGLVPILDMIAVAFLRQSAPAAGAGLLWAFPAIWLSIVFGLAGVVTVSVAVVVMMTHQLFLGGTHSLAASTFVLPLTIAAVSTMAYLSSVRAHAQRELLEKQSAELRRSVERARHQEDLVTEVLDAVDFGVIRITRSGGMSVRNEAHARLQGTPNGTVETVAAFASDGVTPLANESTPLARARAGEVFESEVVWYGAPGEQRRALSVTARRMVDPSGAVAGAVVVSRDVTAEEQALRAREDLVASVSHELRTPLTSVLGYLELALDDPGLPESIREQLTIAERNAARLRELVADILAMSAASRHGVDMTLQIAPTDLAAIVWAAVESEAPRAAERGIHLDVVGIRTAVAGVDAHRLRQVVDNLLSNAVKYNARGGTVVVEVIDGDDDVRISVSDDGPGISEVEQVHLFQRFFRADAVRNSSIHGSGLGLAISRDIVRAHGGDIDVRTAPGAGAAFTVRLPRPPEGTA